MAEIAFRNSGIVVLSKSPSGLGGIRECVDIEFVDVGQQLAERPRSVIDQALAFLH
jgi:hypothetical protein